MDRRVRLNSSEKTCPKDRGPSNIFITVRNWDNRIVEIIELRHHINHPILGTWGGHIGYCVRPDERGKVYATKMLKYNRHTGEHTLPVKYMNMWGNVDDNKGEFGMNFKLIIKKPAFIVPACLFLLAVVISVIITVNRLIDNKPEKSDTKAVSTDEIRNIKIYTVDSGQRELIEKYAEEYWDFDYYIDFYDRSLAYSTTAITEVIMDKLINEPDAIDLYCVPAYATEFVKGELSEYACTYRELGIDVKKALKMADIPQYIIDNGCNPEGELIALPYNATVSLFAYRRSVAKEVFGTDDPNEINKIIGGGSNSWDSFIDAAQILKKHGYYIVPGYMDLAIAVDNSFSLTDEGNINPTWIEYMDVAKFLYDHGYIKDTRIWTQNWYEALDDKGDIKEIRYSDI